MKTQSEFLRVALHFVKSIGYAMHYSRSHDAVIRVYDDAGNVIPMLASR
jgi:hypothetical protein